MEGRHTTINSSLEELVLERSRTLGRGSTCISNLNMIKHNLARIISADDTTPIGRFLGIGSDDDWFFGSS